ncbi:hypothetical protein K2173_025973 [Erythroxylum novogranatense]|uniref:Serpin domain-containing protein n=1 Tax=Erythroxylum novogranatense TaxID=1862640 RepID=A0AAV8SHV0_9ROSI|nr:hypothetical protein K2173_025973 [Erythroxylum novogranatense]
MTSKSDTKFSLDMAAHILSIEVEKGSNFLFSPLSFHSMLSLIALGSKGSTLEQLLSYLGSQSVNELISSASETLSSVLSPSTGSNGGPVVSFVNGAWIRHGLHFKPSFKELVSGIYHATVQEVDFVINKGNNVVNEVNSWAESASNGLIKDLLPQGSLESDTALVLANALYFKGAWDRRFDESKTQHKEFYLLDGQIVQVPFMTIRSDHKNLYGSYDGYKVLQLPYQSGLDNMRFSMYFFLPDARDGLAALVEKLRSNPKAFDGPLSLREENLRLFWVPRFKFAFNFEASKTMQELGLELPFKDTGELSEMVDSAWPPVLSKLFHKAYIEVNEEGTEAAVSTCSQYRLRCGRLGAPTFVADHPFIFIIKEENSGLLLFIGAVLDPHLVS